MLTCDLKGSRDPANDGLEADVGGLQGVSPVPNPPGPVVGVAVNTIWEADDLKSAGIIACEKLQSDQLDTSSIGLRLLSSACCNAEAGCRFLCGGHD